MKQHGMNCTRFHNKEHRARGAVGSIAWKEGMSHNAADHPRDNGKPGKRFKPENNINGFTF